MAPTLFFVVWVSVVVALIVRAVIAGGPGGFEAWRVRRRHARTASTAIAALPENELGQITGVVSPTEPLVTAPLSGRPCVYYTVIVSQKRKHWEVLFSERRGAGFAITDGTGRAIVDPSNARLALCFDRTENVGWLDTATPEQEAILARHGVRSTGLLFRKTLRFEEAVIEVGEHISVIGAGIREPGDPTERETDYRSGAPTQLRIMNSPDAPLSLYQPSLD